MATIKYLCVDDEPLATSKPLLDPLKVRQPRLEFAFEEPIEFSKLLKQIKSRKADGLILDIRLDENANSKGEVVDFRGLTVAQELRTRMTEGLIPSIPIVLWSVVRKFNQSFTNDLTSHDLFDAVYDKERHVTDNPELVARELVALYDGYARIGKPSKDRESILSLLGIQDIDQNPLDPRFAEFELDPQTIPAHDIVGHVLRRLVIPPGPLIPESYLAARLGIDIAASEDWPKLLAKLNPSTYYEGVFTKGWPRWWNHKVLSWWNEVDQKRNRLQALDAAERVASLQKATRLKKLVPAKPIDKDSTSKFWTVCQVLGRPLDPADGVRLKSPSNDPFHDPLYASILSVLERKHVQAGLEVDPLELPRLERIKNAKKTKTAK